MDVRVRFVFNISTGEVEEFEIDDLGSRLPRQEHNRQHDRVSAEIAHVVDKTARVSQVRDTRRDNKAPVRSDPVTPAPVPPDPEPDAEHATAPAPKLEQKP